MPLAVFAFELINGITQFAMKVALLECLTLMFFSGVSHDLVESPYAPLCIWLARMYVTNDVITVIIKRLVNVLFCISCL